MAPEIKKRTVVVVGPCDFRVAPDMTSGSGVAAWRIMRALAMNQGIQELLLLVANKSDIGGVPFGQEGVNVTYAEVGNPIAALESGYPLVMHYSGQMRRPGFDPHAAICSYYSAAVRHINAMTPVPGLVIFNDLPGSAREPLNGMKKGITVHNIVHLPPMAETIGMGIYGSTTRINDSLGVPEVPNWAVSRAQLAASASGLYAGMIENAVDHLAADMPNDNDRPISWPPRRAVFIGQCIRAKGLDLAIKTCKLARESGWAPDLELDIIGAQNTEDPKHFWGREIQPLLYACPWVHYYGPGDQRFMNSVLKQADLGFFLSNPRDHWIEAFGLTGAEMLAARVPILGIEDMGFLNGFTPPNGALCAVPWDSAWTLGRYATQRSFADIALERLKAFAPDRQAAFDSVRHLAIDLYGERLLETLLPKQRQRSSRAKKQG
jgi:hypothetical protein